MSPGSNLEHWSQAPNMDGQNEASVPKEGPLNFLHRIPLCLNPVSCRPAFFSVLTHSDCGKNKIKTLFLHFLWSQKHRFHFMNTEMPWGVLWRTLHHSKQLPWTNLHCTLHGSPKVTWTQFLLIDIKTRLTLESATGLCWLQGPTFGPC